MIKYLKSLRFRIFILFWIFGIFLIILYTILALLFSTSQKRKAEFIYSELKLELEYFIDQYRSDNNTPLPQSRFLKTYKDLSRLPREIQDKASRLTTGYHNFSRHNSKGNNREYYISIQKHPDGISRIYMLYNYNELEEEFTANFKSSAFRRFSLAFYIIVVLSLLIGLVTSKRLISPLKKLVSLIKNTKPENLPVKLSKEFPGNEVGTVADALEKAMQRIRDFIEREKNFTRDSSHELRTPVTIIKGAVELIRQQPETNSDKINRPLQRIERSLNDMEILIDTFLWLGREHTEDDYAQICSIKEVIENVVEENEYLLSGKAVSIQLAINDNPAINVPKHVLKIAVRNLVRNAFYYTQTGKVKISANNNYVEIADTGTGIKSGNYQIITEAYVKGDNSKGSGLGLNIVSRICKRFNWKLEITGDSRPGTCVRLIFNI